MSVVFHYINGGGTPLRWLSAADLERLLLSGSHLERCASARISHLRQIRRRRFDRSELGRLLPDDPGYLPGPVARGAVARPLTRLTNRSGSTFPPVQMQTTVPGRSGPDSQAAIAAAPAGSTTA